MSTEKSKIAILHFSSPPVVGGVENVIYQHARLLHSAGFDVTILSGRGASIGTDIHYQKIPLFDAKHANILAIHQDLDQGIIPGKFEKITSTIKETLEATLPIFDLVIAHNVFTLNKNIPLTAALHHFCQDHPERPIIGWHHDLSWAKNRNQEHLKDKWPWNLTKSRWGFPGFTHVTISQERKKQVAELMKIPLSEIHVIPSGIDFFKFLNVSPKTMELFTELDLLSKFPVFLLPVRVTRRKNIECALFIMEELSKYYADAALIITGPVGAHNPTNDAYLNYLLELKNDLDSHRKNAKGPAVFFLANVTDEFLPDDVIADLYRLSDCLLITSKEEGFGIPIIEAGTLGMPIFCPKLPSFEEIAAENLNYFDLNAKPEDIANLIYSKLQDNKPMNLKAKVKKQYLWESIFNQKIKPLIESKIIS